MGVSMRDGVRLAAEEINKSGGVLGRQLQLVERDDEAKNERGVQIAQELINKEKVTATVGFINTGVALASQRFYQEAKIPVMNNVATGSAITHQFDDQPENYVFRNSAHDSIQAPMLVEEAIVRRAQIELGTTVGTITVALPDFRYRAVDASGIVENEICPVYTAVVTSELAPNPAEVAEWAWVSPSALRDAASATPFAYSPWLVWQLEQWGERYTTLGTP